MKKKFVWKEIVAVPLDYAVIIIACDDLAPNHSSNILSAGGRYLVIRPSLNSDHPLLDEKRSDLQKQGRVPASQGSPAVLFRTRGFPSPACAGFGTTWR